jgi:hypothetical protein
MWCVAVCDLEISNEEAKAHCGAVGNTTTVGCNGRKTKKKATQKARLFFTFNKFSERECGSVFGAESFVFQFAIQKFKD